MGNKNYKFANFEQVQQCIKSLNRNNNILLNTLPIDKQHCVIASSIPAVNEETIINRMIGEGVMQNVDIIVYGKNYRDESIYNKYNQLRKLGFTNVSIYGGGMFEWLLLQEVYSADNFPTSGKELDILMYSVLET